MVLHGRKTVCDNCGNVMTCRCPSWMPHKDEPEHSEICMCCDGVDMGKKAGEMIHSDAKLGATIEPTSNEEIAANSTPENGGYPLLDGDLHPPEIGNVNAMREALETQAEMEVGKPIADKEAELAAEAGKSVEIDAKPGKQIIINIASEGDQESGVTSGHGGGMFGGTDLSQGPGFDVKYKLKGKDGVKQFKSQAAADAFVKGATVKFDQKIAFGDMGNLIQMPKPKGNPKAQELHALLTKMENKEMTGLGMASIGTILSIAQGLAKELRVIPEWKKILDGIRNYQADPDALPVAITDLKRILTRLNITSSKTARFLTEDEARQAGREYIKEHGIPRWMTPKEAGFFSPEDAKKFRDNNQGSNVALRDIDDESDEESQQKWEPMYPDKSKDFGRTLAGLEKDDEYYGYQCAVCHTENFTRDEDGALRCLTCHPWLVSSLFKGYRRPDESMEDWKKRREQDWKNGTVKEATMPEKGTPEWHRVQVAIKTIQMPDAMAGAMGGMTKDEAKAVLDKYGVRFKRSKEGDMKEAGEGKAKNENELDKEAGFNFFFPGQALKEFYPELQHELVDYPNANNTPMGETTPEMVGDGGHDTEDLDAAVDGALDGLSIVETIQLPGDVGELEEVHTADMGEPGISTSPGGALGLGLDVKPSGMDPEGGVRGIRGPDSGRGAMFMDEFYGDTEAGPSMEVRSSKKADAPRRDTKEREPRGIAFNEEFYQQYGKGPKLALAYLKVKVAGQSDIEQFSMFLKKVVEK